MTPPTTQPARSPRLLLFALLGGVGLWWGWRWYTEPRVPDIPLTEADPAVVEVVRKAQEEVRRQPRSAEAWGQLGMVLSANRLPESTPAAFAQAAALDPQDARWPYLHGLALTPFDPEGALPYLRRAAELCQSGKTHQAAAHLRLAEALLTNGHTEEAEGHFRRVLSLAPDHPSTHYGLGVLAQARGDLTAAKGHWSLSAGSPLTAQKASVQLAALHKRLGDEQTAALYAASARRAPADVPWPDPFLSASLARAVGRKTLEERYTALEKQGDLANASQVARELARDYPDALSYLTLGTALGQAGQFQESEWYLRKSLELEPKLGRAQYYLSLTLFAQGEAFKQQAGKADASREMFRESARWARQAAELNDGYAEAHFQFGLALTCLGEREGAIDAFRRAVRSHPELSEPHYWLGKALAEDGQTREALPHLESAARLAPDGDLRAAQALKELRGERKSP